MVELDHQQIFAKRLRQAREAKEISQRGAAKLLGVSQAALSLWELGKNMPELNMMVKLAEFFDVPYDWLTGTVNAPIIKSVHEVYTVPLLRPAALAKWDFSAPLESVQSRIGYMPGAAAAMEISTDLLHSVCQPKDIAIIERDPKPVAGSIVLLLVDGFAKEPFLRRCYFDGPHPYFITDVPDMPAMTLDQVKIVGRVRELVRHTVL